MIQGSQEWVEARLGKVTASRVADVVARTKTGWGASRANYAAELIAERLTGVPAEKYTNGAMAWGTNNEADARVAYEWISGKSVALAGFIPHPRIPMAGASPDGFVGLGGLLELKCPQTATHLETLLSDGVADRYVKQMQFQMACTDAKWCDFASYDPRLPEGMRLFIKRVERDNKLIADLEKEVIAFLAEIDAKMDALRTRFAPPINHLMAG